MPSIKNAKLVRLLYLQVLVIIAFLGVRPAFAQSTASTVSHQRNTDTALVSKFISGQVSKIGGQEYGKARKIVTGDLNHDGVSDLAVLYTIEGVGGGNNYSQYLAVFLRSNGQLLPVTNDVVGGKGYKSVELESIQDNYIVLSTLSYGANDPMCCPSKKGSVRYALVNGKLEKMQ